MTIGADTASHREVVSCRTRVTKGHRRLPGVKLPSANLAQGNPMKTRSLLFVLLLVAVLMAGCASTLHLEKPTYVIREIKPHVSVGIPLSNSSIDFDVSIDGMNPNSMGCRVDRQEFDLSANYRHLLSWSSNQTTV